jgi:hypothetical protein
VNRLAFDIESRNASRGQPAQRGCSIGEFQKLTDGVDEKGFACACRAIDI